MSEEKDLKLKTAHRAMFTSLAGLDGVYQVQSGSRWYVVASPLLHRLGLPIVNVRGELARHGTHMFRLMPVALPGNRTPPPMHVIPVGKASTLIRKLRKQDKTMRAAQKLEDSQPELPFNDRLPCIVDPCGAPPLPPAARPVALPVPPPVEPVPDLRTQQLARRTDELTGANNIIDSLRKSNDALNVLIAGRDLTIKRAADVEIELRRDLDDMGKAVAVRDARLAKMEEIYANIPPVPGVPTPEKTIGARIREHINAYVRKQMSICGVDGDGDIAKQWIHDFTHTVWEWVYTQFIYVGRVNINQRYENMDPATRPASKLDLAVSLGHGEQLYAMIYKALPVERLKIR